MCGRFAQISIKSVIEEEFNVKAVKCDLKPSYNIAPGGDIPVIIDDGARRLFQFRWGLIPYWSKDPSIGNRMINARSETISHKPSFKSAFKKRRCLIIADGFYEWQKDKGVKIPVYIRLKSQKPFGFAGLYEIWTSHNGKKIKSCSIITTEPNTLLKKIHNRMPVIISKENETTWLNSAIDDKSILFPMLNPYCSDKMEAYQVSQFVNSPNNNSPECVKPV